ncbi:MAG: DUF6519 domain-containing protein [Pyrinomonadaceae bacterium]
MKGDFSRDTFDPTRHFTRVLMQQGRVLLDSDWNEQAAILLHYLQTLAADLIGPYGGPEHDCGFAILDHDDLAALPGVPEQLQSDNLSGNFVIGPGRYYVDGMLCENERPVTYAPANAPGLAQPDLVANVLTNGRYLVYLDVWERHVTAIEDDSIREVALGAHGPDTATRSKVLWQVKTLEVGGSFDGINCLEISHRDEWLNLVKEWQPEQRGLLKAKADEPDDSYSINPCNLSPDARYRGAENQLYRVEIHRGGTPAEKPTFKWSRENGFVALPVRSISGQKVTLEHLGRDARLGVQVGDWVELTDENYVLRDNPGPMPLLQVTNVDTMDMIVTLSGAPPTVTTDSMGRTVPLRKPLLRRWDHKAGDTRIGGLELSDGAALIKVATNDEDNWLALEDGIQIQFVAQETGRYRSGDYWLIPARTATGDVEWPGEVGMPKPQPPHGVLHHYAPLARIDVDATGHVNVLDEDYRRAFARLAECDSSDMKS